MIPHNWIEPAPAKVNLNLHVTGQRDDGYHLLQSLVVFVDCGDTLRVEQDETLHLTIDGPMAVGLESENNLVLRAARAMGCAKGAHLHLTKNLPIASGIGGGSSDAAACLRLLSRFWDIPLPQAQVQLELGADVPVCMSPNAQLMSGIGQTLCAVNHLPAFDLLLVNPGAGVATKDIFAALETKDNPPLTSLPSHLNWTNFIAWLKMQRNDLLAPARDISPQVDAVLNALADSGASYFGMSGSGATCFGIFEPDQVSAQRAATHIAQAHPDWWCATGRAR